MRYSTDPGEIDKADGEALIAAAETAEPEVQVEARGALIDLATEQTLPVGELIGVLIAIVLLTLLFRSGGRDGRDADRRAGRRRGRPDPAGLAVGAARPAVVRGGDRDRCSASAPGSTTRC